MSHLRPTQQCQGGFVRLGLRLSGVGNRIGIEAVGRVEIPFGTRCRRREEPEVEPEDPPSSAEPNARIRVVDQCDELRHRFGCRIGGFLFRMLRHVRRVAGVPSSAHVIEYDGTFTFPVPVAQLWATMAQVDRFSSWWSWLHEFSVEGEGLEHGTVLHGIVAPPLPYRMRLDVVLDECVPERRITALVHGDLEGAARLTFDGDDAETQAHATWTVEMMQQPMRMAARIAHPLLRWGHDRVVDATVDGFRRHLFGENAR